ncbi:MAG: GNAT family N-acetyltransferase [Clostridia bacterium]
MDGLIAIKEVKDMDGAKTVETMARSIWEEHYTPIIGAAQVDYMLLKYQSADRILNDISRGGVQYYLAYFDGTVAGYCALRPDEREKTIFFSKLYVERHMRGKGIARKFMDMVLAYASAGGYRSIWLTVNRNNVQSIEAYKRLGFSIIGEVVTDIGNGFVMDDYKMNCRVAD